MKTLQILIDLETGEITMSVLTPVDPVTEGRALVDQWMSFDPEELSSELTPVNPVTEGCRLLAQLMGCDPEELP